MSQQEYNLKEQKAAHSSTLYLQSRVQGSVCCKSKAGAEIGWLVFEFQMQYLVLQKAGVCGAKSIEAFTWSLHDRHCQPQCAGADRAGEH